MNIRKLQHYSVFQWIYRRGRPAEEDHTMSLVPLLPRRQNLLAQKASALLVVGEENGG